MVDDKRNKKLTHLQELAVRNLAKGKNLAAAARAVGVSRQTIYNWISQPAFIAAMNRWRESAVTLAQGQILAGLGGAADTVVKAAREGDARIALALLEKSGAFAPIARHLTDPEQVAREQALAQRAERAGLDQAERDLADAEELNTLRQFHDLPPSPIRMPSSAAEKKPAKPNPPGEPQGADDAIGQTSPGPTAPPTPPPAAPTSPEPPPIHPGVLAKPRPSARPPGYVSDAELEKAIADADALKAREAAWLEEQRKAREHQEPQPPPPPQGVSHDPSNPSPPPVPPPAARAPAHPKTARRHAYSRGMPEPIDELDDQFTDIWREDRRG